MVSPKPERTARERNLRIAAAVLGGLVVLFAALNLDTVEVNWILGTWETPLFVVIGVAFLLGAGLGYLLAGRRAKRRLADGAKREIPAREPVAAQPGTRGRSRQDAGA